MTPSDFLGSPIFGGFVGFVFGILFEAMFGFARKMYRWLFEHKPDKPA